MKSADRQEWIEKIKKILKHARDEACTPEEAATYMAKAMEFQAKLAISDAELEDEDCREFSEEKIYMTNLDIPTYMQVMHLSFIGCAAAENMGGHAICTTSGRSRRALIVHAKKEIIGTVVESVTTILLIVMGFAKQTQKELKSRGTKFSANDYFSGFCYGYSKSLRDKTTQVVSTILVKSSSESYEYSKEAYDLQTVKGRDPKDRSNFLKGYKDGYNANTNQKAII